jgi:antitoxin component of RelBE/YafQ-DinJ toxin-antitoxin module
MTTQVVFRLDKKVKDKAMKRAKREGVPFASVMKFAARAYAQERFHVDIGSEEQFNAKTAKEIRGMLREIKAGNMENFSPGFTNMKDAIAWMRRKDK